jgi:hypothetical protein
LRFARPRRSTLRVSGYGLALWSFLMSSAHGAGPMVTPLLHGVGGWRRRAAQARHGRARATVAPSPTAIPRCSRRVSPHPAPVINQSVAQRPAVNAPGPARSIANGGRFASGAHHTTRSAR